MLGRKRRALLVLTVLVAACTPARSDGGYLAMRPDQTPTPACVRFWPEARYRPYGYDHVVHIRNGCTATAACMVTTDVNPQAIPAAVPPNAEVEVLTWIGSPARTFTPSVWCQLRSGA